MTEADLALAPEPPAAAEPEPTTDELIAAVFGDGHTSAEVAALIPMVDAEVSLVIDAADRARLQALNPRSSPAEVQAARQELEDLTFRRDRLETALQELTERRRELLQQEEDARRWKRYREIEAERDALAAELKELYPAFAGKLGDLFGRIRANDQKIEDLTSNRQLPTGARPPLEAELVARGIDNWLQHNGMVTIPRLTSCVRLPAFAYDGQARVQYEWPKIWG